MLELSPLSGFTPFLMSLYALFTLNTPFLSSLQINLSLQGIELSGILRITVVVGGLKIAWIKWIFHLLVPSSIKEATWVSCMSKPSWSCGVGRVSMPGIRLCFQIVTFSLLPIHHILHLRSHGLASHIPCQAKDGLHLTCASKNEVFEKYLALYNWCKSEPSSYEIRQPCLARRVKLKVLNFLKPKPPWNFERHILCQLIYWIFFSWYFWPHQNYPIRLSSSQNVVESWKQLMVKVGITRILLLLKVPLPLIEKWTCLSKIVVFAKVWFLYPKRFFFRSAN